LYVAIFIVEWEQNTVTENTFYHKCPESSFANSMLCLTVSGCLYLYSAYVA
jgi:hypothetical protein